MKIKASFLSFTNLIIILIFCSGFANGPNTGDDPVIANIVTHIDKWLSYYQTEKVYLQTDKPYYAAGDDIWFKVYVTVGNAHHLSLLSSAINVELIDKNDTVKRWIKLPLNSGTAWGNINLPDTLPAGNYRIRAYTNWMRNEGPAYYFDKVIAIGKLIDTGPVGWMAPVIKGNTGKSADIVPQINVAFFPESGSLVNGIKTIVAFKAVRPDGLGADIKGVITDNENNKITEFSSQHLGMGKFIIRPETGKSYKALITYENGLQGKFNLPKALPSGCVLNIDNTDTANLRVKVTLSNDLVNAGHPYIYAQSGGETRFVAMSNSTGNTFGAVIPTGNFPSGIVQFTLFSATGEPLNERITFIQHNSDFLNLKISSANGITTPREKVKIDLDAQSYSGKPIIGSFSVAVTDQSKVPYDEAFETTLLSHILLTSDIKGYVEQPNYYFINTNDTTRANLDILMLTQGYRRFEWKQILSDKVAPIPYQPEKLTKISGTVKRLLGGKPVADAKVSLLTIGSKSFFMLDTVADKEGHFTFKGLFLKDSLKFMLQARTPKDGNKVEIVLDDNGNEDIITGNKYLPTADLLATNQLSNYLKARKKLSDEELKYGLGNHTIVLKEVKVVAKQKTAVDYSNNLNGPGRADQVINSDVLEQRTAGCAFLPDCLQGLLSGVIFHNGQPYSARGYAENVIKIHPMEIIMDGVKIASFDAISPDDVGSIEVLKNPAYTALYGLNGSNGVLIITSKHGSRNTAYLKQPPVGSVYISPKGFYRAREFYSPQYDDPKTNKAIADLRTTIYWKPNIVTDSTGHASFEYYNAGTPGTYSVIIEGIDADGNLGRKIYKYEVK